MDSTSEPNGGSDSSLCSSSVQRVGPKVRVCIEYECNGCQFHKIDVDKNSEAGWKYHACHHPLLIKKYSRPQWIGGGRTGLTSEHRAITPKAICPYLMESED